MFTGIITGIGELVARREGRFTIRCGYPAAGIAIGASIACDGACLTATEVAPSGEGSLFTVDVSNETLACTTLGQWRLGRAINLERALRAGDELGGHSVAGRVDGGGLIRHRRADGPCVRLSVEVPDDLVGYLAPKGSIALDGISLTLNEVAKPCFGVNIVPHTLTHTTLGAKTPGDLVNLEADVFARYVVRAM